MTTAVPAPFPGPTPIPENLKPQSSQNPDDLKDGEEDKDLKGSESAYYGYYGGYPWGSYPSYYYSSVHHASPYYAYAYRPYSYWW